MNKFSSPHLLVVKVDVETIAPIYTSQADAGFSMA